MTGKSHLSVIPTVSFETCKEHRSDTVSVSWLNQFQIRKLQVSNYCQQTEMKEGIATKHICSVIHDCVYLLLHGDR